MVDLPLLGFAFALGASTFFAPCASPLLPGYVSYYLGQGSGDDVTAATDGGPATPGLLAGVDATGRLVRVSRAVVIGVVVSAGFFTVYGVLAGIVVAVGARALADISVLELVVGLALVGLGTAMATGWKPSALPVQLPERRRSVFGYFGFGVLYAAAAAGCTAPLFIAVALRGMSEGAVAGVVTLAAYAAGMSVLMIGVTVGAALGRDALVGRISRHSGIVYRIAGVLLVVAGIVQVYLFLFRFDGLRILGL